MLINKDWKIESDPFNITLYRRHISKKAKKEYWVAEGYFSNIKNLLKALVDFEVASTGLKDLQTVSRKQDELHKMIEALPRSLVAYKRQETK